MRLSKFGEGVLVFCLVFIVATGTMYLILMAIPGTGNAERAMSLVTGLLLALHVRHSWAKAYNESEERAEKERLLVIAHDAGFTKEEVCAVAKAPSLKEAQSIFDRVCFERGIIPEKVMEAYACNNMPLPVNRFGNWKNPLQ
jgi:hypothetical protein